MTEAEKKADFMRQWKEMLAEEREYERSMQRMVDNGYLKYVEGGFVFTPSGLKRMFGEE